MTCEERSDELFYNACQALESPRGTGKKGRDNKPEGKRRHPQSTNLTKGAFLVYRRVSYK